MGKAVNELDNYPYCDFFKYHEKSFNYGLCPCGNSFSIGGQLRCSLTKEEIKKRVAGGYYYKCEYMRRVP